EIASPNPGPVGDNFRVEQRRDLRAEPESSGGIDESRDPAAADEPRGNPGSRSPARLARRRAAVDPIDPATPRRERPAAARGARPQGPQAAGGYAAGGDGSDRPRGLLPRAERRHQRVPLAGE